MKRSRVAFHLAWIGLTFLVVAGTTMGMSDPTAAPRDIVASSESAAMTPDALPGGPGTEDFTPVACKRLPECSVDSDCVVFCGPSGGHCVHSSCPIRICKCR